MTNQSTIIDALETPQPGQVPFMLRYQRVFVIIELVLLLLILFALLFKYESWEGGSEAFILTMTVLMVYYFFGAPLIFGSVGARRHLGAFLAGFALMIGVAAVLFKIESWSGGAEMAIIASMMSMMLAFLVFILALTRKKDGHKSPAFFWWILLRLVAVALLNGWVLIELFRP